MDVKFFGRLNPTQKNVAGKSHSMNQNYFMGTHKKQIYNFTDLSFFFYQLDTSA